MREKASHYFADCEGHLNYRYRYSKEFIRILKREHNSKNPLNRPRKLWHAHLHIIGAMCGKFHWDVLLTPVYSPILVSLVGGTDTVAWYATIYFWITVLSSTKTQHQESHNVSTGLTFHYYWEIPSGLWMPSSWHGYRIHFYHFEIIQWQQLSI